MSDLSETILLAHKAGHLQLLEQWARANDERPLLDATCQVLAELRTVISRRVTAEKASRP